jgi:2-dehydropantoate 2-reductase
MMRIAVMGTGGVGGYFGARLAQGGCEVGFIARGAHLTAMHEQGLTLRSRLGDIHLASVLATDDPASLGPVDFVIIAVKLWDTEAAARAVAPIMGPGTAILSLQNGVVKDDILRRVLGDGPVIGGTCYIAAAIEEPGVIAHTGTMARMVFGEYDGSRSGRAEALLEACWRADIDAELSADIRRVIWEKFVLIAGFNGTTAAVRTPIGPIRTNPQARAFLLDAMSETVAVGRALGVNLPPDYAQARLAFCDGLPAEMTSSTLTDLERGNRLEIPWLAGAVVELGRTVAIPTPVNRAISDILAVHAAGREVTSA